MKKSFRKLICGCLLSLSTILCSNYFAEPYALPNHINNIYMELFKRSSVSPNLGEELYNSINELPTDKDKINAFFWIFNEQINSGPKIEDISSFADKILEDNDMVAFEFYGGTHYHPGTNNTYTCDFIGNVVKQPVTDKIKIFVRNKKTGIYRYCELRRHIVFINPFTKEQSDYLKRAKGIKPNSSSRSDGEIMQSAELNPLLEPNNETVQSAKPNSAPKLIKGCLLI